MTSRSDRRLEIMALGHAHAGGGRLGRREWWEQVMLRQIKEEASVFRTVDPDDHEWRTRKQRDIKVLGYALLELRRHSRRWALKQIIRVSEALGLYQEDAEHGGERAQ